MFNRAVLVALSIVTIAFNASVPANAFVGRLGGHSLGTVKRWQQIAGRGTHSTKRSSHKRGRFTEANSSHHHDKLAVEFVRDRHGRLHKIHSHHGSNHRHIARGISSPSYIWSAPSGENPLLSDESLSVVEQDFANGCADKYAPSTLIQAGVIESCPLHGGVFKRRADIKHIILHSTETARVADAQRVIASWNHKGLRHAGAQFVVDRDGQIYCTADPTFGTTHVDNRRTIHGVNNDNSIGIEIVRTGSQEYSSDQLQSVVYLVRYLQDRFKVSDNCVLGHGQVQPSDRSDPVNFNWQAFASDKQTLTRTAFTARQ